MKKFNIELCKSAFDSGISQAIFNRLLELKDCEGVYGCDLHSRLFNEKEFYISIAKAEEDLEEVGVFNAIRLCKSYEDFHFGELNTPIEPCRVANMVCYIVGEIIHKSEHLTDKCWDNELTEEDLAIIENELQIYLESLDEDLSNVAFNEYEV